MLIKSDDLYAFLHKAVEEKLDGYTDVILPGSKGNGGTFFGHLGDDFNIVLDSYRTVDPVKILFYLTRERMQPDEWATKKRIILGVKACDLRALELLDRALINQDFVDPAYKHWRENSTIVTTDCSEIADTCHCNLLDGLPFAESGFDLNLSRLDENFVVNVGSEKGEALLNLMKKQVKLEQISETVKQQVDDNRNAVRDLLVKQNSAFPRSKNLDHMRSVELDWWSDESRACIGCGACTNICPTCYCLILNDETEAQKFIKERTYDSCQWSGYARVAGGGTPRPEMGKRFRNRYLCKFDYMPHNFDRIGCTGCGRCTDACAAQIDFREVVSKASAKEPVTQ